jgi:hypothetical protein
MEVKISHIKLKRARTCDGCIALESGYKHGDYRYRLNYPITRINIAKPGNTNFIEISSPVEYKYVPAEPCSKPLTIKRFFEIKNKLDEQ